MVTLGAGAVSYERGTPVLIDELAQNVVLLEHGDPLVQRLLLLLWG